MRTRWYGGLLATLLFSLSFAQAADDSVEPIVSRIPRQPVASSALATVGYSKRLHALEIEFHDGSIYRYLEIPRALHEELLAAESKAGYYNSRLRGRYRCVRVKRPRPR
ncbi:MAG: KTSC domain-containing protein [Chthoniobacterales bacterium]